MFGEPCCRIPSRKTGWLKHLANQVAATGIEFSTALPGMVPITNNHRQISAWDTQANQRSPNQLANNRPR
jgi:hypothetical protein